MNPIVEFGKLLIKPISDYAVSRTQRRIAKDNIDGQVKMAKVQGQNEAAVSVADWELNSKAQEGGTWKDEYVTVSVFSLFNLVVVGGVLTGMGFAAGPEILTGVETAVDALNEIDGTVGFMVKAVGLAAIGLKVAKEVR